MVYFNYPDRLRTSSDPPGLILIEGESGIGKSALVFDSIQSAEAMGVLVLTGEGTLLDRYCMGGLLRQ